MTHPCFQYLQQAPHPPLKLSYYMAHDCCDKGQTHNNIMFTCSHSKMDRGVVMVQKSVLFYVTQLLKQAMSATFHEPITLSLKR